jgi:hypothetical protein
MVEVKYDRSHPAGATPEARLANRLNNSGDAKNADVVTKHGEGARRTFHNIFNAGHKIQPNTLPKKGLGE